jgi:hypothetical protein
MLFQGLKNSKIIILFIVFIISLQFISVAIAGIDEAFKTDGVNSKLNKAAKYAGYEIISDDPFFLISTIINLILSFLGVIFLILMIYGGYQWMTAGGDEQKVEKAKGLIRNAIIGLIVVIAAYAISYFVVAKFGEKVLLKSQ